MMKKLTIALLIAAYALLLAAMVASLALFGVQWAENKELQMDLNDLSGRIERLEVEKADLEAELAAAQAFETQLMQTEQLVETLTQRTQALQAQLDAIPQYTFDVNDVDAGTLVEADQLDPNDLEDYFTAQKIVEGDAVFERINGKSYKDNDDIGLDELRYMKVLHYNFDHKIQVGELIVNAALVPDYQEIFLELFQNGYEINSMFLIDNYWTGDGLSSDSASIDANNTSAFCYRKAAGSGNLSNHAMGRAIDINPQQNPYVTFDSNGNPKWTHDNADDYIDRDSGMPHVITHDDLAFKLFEEHGFEWGGDWRTLKDYQHFEKEK